MNKKIFLGIFFLLVFFPSIASAVWWNPFSWGKSDQNPKSVDVLFENTQQNPSEIPVEEEKVETVNSSDTKVITKTVQIDNPELLKKISALQAERDQIKSSLDYASKKIIELNVKIEELNKIISNNKTEQQSLSLSITNQCSIEKEQIRIDATKQGENNQRQKETYFFNELILDIDNPDPGGRLCISDRIYNNSLETFTQACKTFMERNFPVGQK